MDFPKNISSLLRGCCVSFEPSPLGGVDFHGGGVSLLFLPPPLFSFRKLPPPYCLWLLSPFLIYVRGGRASTLIASAVGHFYVHPVVPPPKSIFLPFRVLPPELADPLFA